MSVYLQNGIWWYEFRVGKQRYRSSTRTADRATAQQIEAEHRESFTRTGQKVSLTLREIKAAERAVRTEKIWAGTETQTEVPASIKARHKEHSGLTPQALLSAAGELFIEKQRERCRAKTLECNQGHLHRLLEFFGDIPLGQFTIAHFEHYQSVRGAKCSSSTVNHELNTLGRILKRVDLWHPIRKNYSPLKDQERDRKPLKIFNAAEQERIFGALKGNPDLELSAIVFNITRNTTASGCELRGLRLSSLELDADPPRMHIPPDSTKNTTRPRTIPLNGDALNACRLALERAKRLGSHYPEDYVFPFRIDRTTWDPKRPASKSWLRKQVEQLREITGIDHINPHTFRHLAVTELLERGASEQTVVSIAGWVGRRMFETYSHPRLEAKAEAVQLLENKVARAMAPAQTRPPALPGVDVHAELARLRQLVEQLQAQAGRSGGVSRKRLRSRRISPGGRTLPASTRARLITFPGAG